MKLLSLIFFLIPASLVAQDADDILGYWLTDDGEAKIQIFKEGGKYHGEVVWLKEPLDENGKPKTDTQNPEKEKRKKPVIGMRLVYGFEFEDDQWEGGEIYDPKEGKTYECRIRLKRGKLEVRGFIGMPMFGRTVVWTKTSL
jgi:uncharacterized protein (DUF2147 family)